jgi:hypothetical protein
MSDGLKEGGVFDYCPGCGAPHGDRPDDALARVTGYCRACRNSLADNDDDERDEERDDEIDERRGRQLLRTGLLWAVLAAVLLLALASLTRSR